MRGLGAIAIVVALLVACSSKPSDDKISKDIQSNISTRQETRDSHVEVQSQRGRVTLRGTAPTEVARRELERTAQSEPGVVAVDDQTVVAAPETAEAPPERALPNSSEAPAETSSKISSVPFPPAVRPTVPSAPAARPAPPPPKPIVVPSETMLTVRLDQAVGSKESQIGHTFSGMTSTPISIEGKTVIPSGSVVTGIVRHAKKAGRFKGAAELTLTLDSITVNGKTYNIETEDFFQSSKGKGKRTAGLIGGGTGVGAVIGGIAGGGTGAAIGALSGAAAGTVGAGATGNKRDISLPAESALPFKLIKPLKLKP